MRYKTWRSRNDTHLHVLCGEGSEAFESLPVAIRNLGPWTGGPDGDVDWLRLPYRILLNEQRFVVIHAHVSELVGERQRPLTTAPSEHRMPPVQVDGPRAYASWLAGQGMPSMRRARVDQADGAVESSLASRQRGRRPHIPCSVTAPTPLRKPQ